MSTTKPQVLLQLRPDIDEDLVRCAGFTGLPSAQPALIVISAAPAPDAQRQARRLYRSLEHALVALGDRLDPWDLPCQGELPDALQCFVHGRVAYRRLLVVCASASGPVASDPWVPYWDSRVSAVA